MNKPEEWNLLYSIKKCTFSTNSKKVWNSSLKFTRIHQVFGLLADSKKHLIGRSDMADFPLFELFDIPIKVDTGAYTSSIHCKDIEEVDDTLQCSFLDPSHPEYNEKRFIFNNYDIATVKSSNGTIEIRYAVQSKITLFSKTYPITLTLTSREDMRFPVLLGRKFLSGKFIVDPQLENLSYKN